MAPPKYRSVSETDLMQQLVQNPGVVDGMVPVVINSGTAYALQNPAAPANGVTSLLGLVIGNLVVATAVRNIEDAAIQPGQLVLVAAGLTVGRIPTIGATGKDLVDGPGVLQAIAYKENAPAIAAGVLTLNCLLGPVHKVSLNGNIATFNVTNWAAADWAQQRVVFVTDGTQRTIVWPGAANFWDGGVAATPTVASTAGSWFIVDLCSDDAGVTVLKLLVCQSAP